MKKMLSSLALVGLAALAFGQDAPKAVPSLALSGYLDVGATVLANGKDSAQFGLWGEDAGKNGGRSKLIGKYDNAGYGVNFELRADGLQVPSFITAFAYGTFIDKLVYGQVGLIKEETSKTGGDAGFTYTKETAGAVVLVKPFDGFSVNAFVAPAYSLGNPTIASVNSLADTTTGFGAAYTLANVVKVVGEARFQNPQFAYTTTTSVNTNNTYALTDVYAGVGFLSVPNLTAWLEVQNSNLNAGKLDGKTTLVETVSYGFKDLGVAPLTAGVIAYQYLYGEDKKNAIVYADGSPTNKDAYGLSLKLTPWASYALDGGVTPKLAVTYFSGAEVVASKYSNDLSTGLPRTYVDTKKASAANVNKQAILDLKPSVKITLTPTQSLSFVYSFITSVGDEKLTFLSGNVDATSLHTFQTVYTHSF